MGTAKGRILVGEDDPDQRSILSELLSQEGFEVTVAASAPEVVERLLQAPDVLLLDVAGVVNPAVLRAIDAQPARPAVVLLSADSQLAQWARRLKADAHLAKPLDLGDLLATVAAVLRGRLLAQRVLSHTFA